ncbi:surface antigen-domain-containing protein [Gautieria morchelliformis]|nr:surface antigen-domain-containing protein [Gautieria morchelliformis]
MSESSLQEDVLKWQEARVERRVRGEYESQLLRHSELVHGNLTLPLRIRAVRVEGAPRTRASFLASIIDPLLSANVPTQVSAAEPPPPQTLESALHTTRRISDVLIRSDIFSSVAPRLEVSRDARAQLGDVDLVIRCRERGRFFLKTATEIGNNEGTASATARVRNIFGGTENFDASISYGSHTRHAFSAALSMPLSPSLRTTGMLSLYGTERDLSRFASCREALKGARAAIRTGSLYGSHEFAYEAVLRHVGDLSAGASVSIREAAGFTTKMSVSHVFVRDTRDSAATPTRGWYLKLMQAGELAGFGGDASFFKSEGVSQVARYVGCGQTVSFSTRAGVLYPLGPNYRGLFNDRFQLGGPFSVRSFRGNSLGPRDGSDSLGGDVYWAVGASLVGDMPGKGHWPVKTHLFVNAGRLDRLERAGSLGDTVRSSVWPPSVSAGIGLLYRFEPIRVEVNFAMPLAAARSDGLQRGFQAGVGLEFM